jgi:hypothetical protein
MGFHAFHKPDFPPSQIRLCVAGFGSVGLMMIRKNRAPNPSLQRD